MIHFGQGSTKRPSPGLEKLGPFLWKLTGSASRGGLSACGPVGVGGYLNCSNKPQWITVQVGQGFGVELSGSDTRTKAQVQVLEPGTAGFLCNLNARGRGLGSTTGYKQDPREYILTI